MKLLSIAIPSYNSEAFMRKCIDSLVPGGDEVEILIINDGSKDGTGQVADEYAARYPGICRAIHQENAGHGGAVNSGIREARGLFFKVVDSDDWVDPDAYAQILDALREFAAGDMQEAPDVILSNFVYEKEGKKKKSVMRYANVLPEGRIFHWSEIGNFHKGQYLLMHAIIYKMSLLRASGLELPEHTFYVDNLYAYIPLAYVHSLYYLDVDFYRYFIGREGQSVQEDVMIKRIDQQLKVNRLMFTSVDLEAIEDKAHRNYLFNYLEIVTIVSTILLLRGGEPEHDRKRHELYAFIKDYDEKLYRRIRYGALGMLANLPSKVGRKISLKSYEITRMFYGFN